jgi:hypothetical protein
VFPVIDDRMIDQDLPRVRDIPHRLVGDVP